MEPHPSDARLGTSRPARGRRLGVILAATAGIAIPGVVLFNRTAGASAKPGKIVSATFSRDRSGSPRVAAGAPATASRPGTVRKVYLRGARKYSGPVPTEAEIKAYCAKGQADAFYDLLRPEHRARVSAKIREVESALDELGDAIDAAIDQAKDRIRGTADEQRLAFSELGPEQRQARSREVRHAAQAVGDMVVSEAGGDAEVYFRIRRNRFPEVFRLREEDSKLTLVRQDILHDEVGRLLEAEGVAALDPERLRDSAAEDGRPRSAK